MPATRASKAVRGFLHKKVIDHCSIELCALFRCATKDLLPASVWLK
jgi:hypothetical protein